MIKLFGQKIKARRKHLKLTLEELALKAGSCKSYIWEIEKKELSNPSASMAYNLSEVLNLSLNYLLNDQIEVGEFKYKQRITVAKECDGIGEVLFSYDIY